MGTSTKKEIYMLLFHCLYELIQLVFFKNLDALPHAAQGKEPTLPQETLKPRFEAIVAKDADALGVTFWAWRGRILPSEFDRIGEDQRVLGIDSVTSKVEIG